MVACPTAQQLLILMALVIALTTQATEASEPIGGPLGTSLPAAGEVVVAVGGGLSAVLPYATAEARVGLGSGLRVVVAYENTGILGQGVQLRLGGAAAASDEATLGLELTAAFATLQPVGEIGGIEFTNSDLGNDFTAGFNLLLGRYPEGETQLTAWVGADFTLASREYETFEESSYVFDPSFRALRFAVQGEWERDVNRTFFIRLEGYTPLFTDIVPIGFFPTIVLGAAWLL